MMQRRIFDVATMLQSNSSRLLHFKKRESPCRSEQKPADALVCSARGHASVNKPIRLSCVYVCTLRATYFCRTRRSRRFFRRIFPFRSSNTSLSLPRLLSSSRLYPTTRCFLLLLLFSFSFLFPDPFILDSLFAVAH